MTLVEAEARLRSASGASLPLPGRRWVSPCDEADKAVIARATAPVLDVGCGPGRHTQALAEQGVVVLGVDLSDHAVAIARDKGLGVLARSIFDAVPRAGRWNSALLLDGNVGIGGDPARLLSHVASLLRPEGQLLVEIEERATLSSMESVRLEIGDEAGPWFDWAQVDLQGLSTLAGEAQLEVTDVWSVRDRWFAALNAGPT